MLFGLIKSAKEKTQEEYKKLLYKRINTIKKYIYDLKKDSTNVDSLVMLMILRQMKVEDKLDDAIKSDLSQDQQKACKEHNSSFFLSDYKNEENIYLENELKDLNYSMLQDNRHIKLTTAAKEKWNYYFEDYYIGDDQNSD
jgi:hypothetical protein